LKQICRQGNKRRQVSTNINSCGKKVSHKKKNETSRTQNDQKEQKIYDAVGSKISGVNGTETGIYVRSRKSDFHLEEGLIIYFAEEPILLNSAGGSRDFFFKWKNDFYCLCGGANSTSQRRRLSRFFFNLEEGLIIYFVEEQILLNSAGGAGFFTLSRIRAFSL